LKYGALLSFNALKGDENNKNTYCLTNRFIAPSESKIITKL